MTRLLVQGGIWGFGLLLALVVGAGLFVHPHWQPGFWLNLFCGISLSASKYGMPLMLLLFLWWARPARRRILPLLLPLLLLLGLGAALNEHVIKPAFAQPRPNIEYLAAQGVLELSEYDFYQYSKARRSAILQRQLAEYNDLPPLLRQHWTAESGFSFPSGHSFAAVGLAFFSLLYALQTQRSLTSVLPWLLWAVSVGWSRLYLGVHRVEDIAAGAAQGMLVAVLAFLVYSWWANKAAAGAP